MIIIPTIFALNKKDFYVRLNIAVKIAKNIQIDLMDGKFVEASSIDLKEIPNLKSFNNNFEAHLMVENPVKYLSKLKRIGIKKIIFHIESGHTKEIIERIKKLDMICFLALNPDTPIEKALPFLKSIDGVLLMGVYPGKENQEFIVKVYNKIKHLREIDKKVFIEIDGGVNKSVALKLNSIGVNAINSGSYIFSSKSPKRIISDLRKVLKKSSNHSIKKLPSNSS